MKKPNIIYVLSVWSDGTFQLVLSPEELLEKLAALVPPPRLNLVRYHGVLAPNAVDRAQIVPGPKPADEETDVGGSEAASTPSQRRHRLAWAVLQHDGAAEVGHLAAGVDHPAQLVLLVEVHRSGS